MRKAAIQLLKTATKPENSYLVHMEPITLIKLGLIIKSIDTRSSYLCSMAEAIQYGSLENLEDLATGKIKISAFRGESCHTPQCIIDRAFIVWQAWSERIARLNIKITNNTFEDTYNEQV